MGQRTDEGRPEGRRGVSKVVRADGNDGVAGTDSVVGRSRSGRRPWPQYVNDDRVMCLCKQVCGIDGSGASSSVYLLALSRPVLLRVQASTRTASCRAASSATPGTRTSSPRFPCR